MKRDLFKITFSLALLVGVIGAFLKITHFTNANVFLAASVALTLSFVVIGILEVHQSSRSFTSKILWSLGFMLFSFFTAILWLINRRESKITAI